ncbi:uncharacterized protein LOC122279406 [Carya illinoinensis]|uniref:SAM domain-containing protein n=1 Tax=Carya illinoinensis TaxID=32201 RepID=A0A8T1P360_CARIL|nr:uncharacterized protein LOC122279406 [Carya illinoinensis]XP_042945985.1 uncharacterized protein LOC122279406 [Carya illinoinensis]XP_042945986.1 uncharacterized protein LOC122279406 [Carya illinoinensis]KAG6638238.1 hypothetical protein CIPAW_10G021900 [Carya illinoinensis]KAG6638239.1 hypothetical protein CIPAW_10G021900 [Carya illinoinensis]KAG6690559.1 hypothetical protein I3842_10G021400 [Carya illinoinensis]KAG6690560.1 hypothetical protein I3842_10G021400 [Carya illinoinensis]
MVGKKQRHLVAIARNKNITRSGHLNSSKSSDDLDVQGEDSWVIVKKQRVTILVPPLPAAKNLKTRNLGPSQLEARPQKTSNQIQPPIDICPRILSVDEEGKSMSLAPEKGIQVVRKAHSQDLPTLAKPPREDLRMETKNTNQVGTSKTCERYGVSDTSKAIKRPRLLHCPSGLIDGARGGMLLSQKLRASNLEIKLKRAGGLSRWLASLGLDQFVRIFQRKSVNKFQLVNLTMKKLKDMGANAVGPRRKLIHAIDCVCQSYCFEAI